MAFVVTTALAACGSPGASAKTLTGCLDPANGAIAFGHVGCVYLRASNTSTTAWRDYYGGKPTGPDYCLVITGAGNRLGFTIRATHPARTPHANISRTSVIRRHS